jgi:hypothetical protein
LSAPRETGRQVVRSMGRAWIEQPMDVREARPDTRARRRRVQIFPKRMASLLGVVARREVCGPPSTPEDEAPVDIGDECDAQAGSGRNHPMLPRGSARRHAGLEPAPRTPPRFQVFNRCARESLCRARALDVDNPGHVMSGRACLRLGREAGRRYRTTWSRWRRKRCVSARRWEVDRAIGV